MLSLKCWNYYERLKAGEKGEVASWLILAAGLAAAAVVAAKTLDGTIQALAGKVGSAAGVGGGGGGGGAGAPPIPAVGP